jgi:hypothetical protein
MHDQRNLTQDAVLRARIAMANRLIAEQSATIARAHSAIERALETLVGQKSQAMAAATERPNIALDASREAGKERLSCCSP